MLPAVHQDTQVERRYECPAAVLVLVPSDSYYIYLTDGIIFEARYKNVCITRAAISLLGGDKLLLGGNKM